MRLIRRIFLTLASLALLPLPAAPHTRVGVPPHRAVADKAPPLFWHSIRLLVSSVARFRPASSPRRLVEKAAGAEMDSAGAVAISGGFGRGA